MSINALDNSREAIALHQKVRPGQTTIGFCQRISGYYESWAYLNTESGITVYPSAYAAAMASPRSQATNVNDLEIGDKAYFDIGWADHVGSIVGYDGNRSLMTHASTNGDTVLELGMGFKVSHTDTYPFPVLRLSHYNGKNARLSGMSAYSLNLAASNEQPWTDAVYDGIEGPKFWRRVQQEGNEAGLYPTPPYVIDGAPGPRTRWVKVILTARILNAARLGRSTDADKDGNKYNKKNGARGYSNYVWLVQTMGRARGWYPMQYKIDGIDGPMTQKVEVKILAEWLNSKR